ncbi:MAG: CaiB/BaiF CoA-transferase family protein, partial [Actinomycetota bacterium]
MTGALDGVRIIELAGMGALPFASLKLADMGADVVRVDRVADVEPGAEPQPFSAWNRGRRSIAVDLKHPDGVETVLRLAEQADALIESFRPGVVERLGVGPDAAMARNPALVYGRLTGWGQEGPLAPAAGHSLNYEAITGVIRAVGRSDTSPAPLLQLLGDFAGGGLSLAYGVVCGVLAARRTGEGQVVDAGMTDGVMSLAQVFYAMDESGMHSPERGTNLFDGGAPFYDVYECADGEYLSVAPIEPHFYARLVEGLGLEGADLPDQYDQTRWPELRARLAEVILTRSRDE